MSFEKSPLPTKSKPKPYAASPNVTEGVHYRASAIFGNSSGDNVLYNLKGVFATQSITIPKWEELETLINRENTRRLNQDPNVTIPVVKGELIKGDYYNTLLGAMERLDKYPIGAGGSWSGVCSEKNFPLGQFDCNRGGGAHVPNIAGGTVSIGTRIDASKFNQLVSEMNAAGNSCFCNCNYCSCNCNYCTCNCHYSCVCNCNYSDENTKENIEYI